MSDEDSSNKAGITNTEPEAINNKNVEKDLASGGSNSTATPNKVNNPPTSPKTNVLAVLGLIFAFFYSAYWDYLFNNWS